MAHRFFIDDAPADGLAWLTGEQAHHLSRVMRAKAGDEVALFDGSGWEWQARVILLQRDRVELQVREGRLVDREAPAAITLGVALPKGDRQRWLVEKLVELGTSRLVPLQTRRGVAQPTQGARERLRKAVIESCKQCGRNRLMEVAPPATWSEFLGAAPREAARLVAHPGGVEGSTRLTALDREDLTRAGAWAAVGPEGGFAEEEISLALAQQWRLVDLGPRILRVETAASALAGWLSLSLL